MIYAALAHLFAVMSPGPDTAIIIREVSLNKRRGGLFCAFGIGVGILIHCYLAIFGISTLLVSNNIAGDLISMFGSFYLIFIGISSFKSESQTSEKSQLMSFLTIVLTHDNIQKKWEPVQEIINKISGSILIGLGCLILINILF
jgi:threonine/homoserine/homoserine lactone efflux protein